MDYLTFIAKTLEIVIWPAVSVTVFLVLRKPIAAAIADWDTFRGKISSVEVEFRRILAVARAEAEEASLPSASAVTTTTTAAPGSDVSVLPAQTIERYKRLIEISPRAGIVAWTDIEAALNGVTNRHGSSQAKSPSQLISELAARGCLDQRTKSLLDELRVLRNDVMHRPSLAVSSEDAIDYALIALRIIARLEKIR